MSFSWVDRVDFRRLHRGYSRSRLPKAEPAAAKKSRRIDSALKKAGMTASVLSIVLDGGHEHVWKRIGHVADMVVLDRCTVAGCGAEHYYDPDVEPPRR